MLSQLLQGVSRHHPGQPAQHGLPAATRLGGLAGRDATAPDEQQVRVLRPCCGRLPAQPVS